MSPRVSITISAADLVALLKPARTHVVEALAAARRRGVWVRCGDPGVVAGLGDWSVANRRDGVSLVGAVLLHLQPDPVDGEEHLEAAARALGASLAWVEGAEAAWCREPMAIAWLGRTDGDLYRDGYHLGEELRRVVDGARQSPGNGE